MPLKKKEEVKAPVTAITAQPMRGPAGLARLDPQSLLQSAVDHGANIETLERLVALAKDVRQEQAKAAYFEAMALFTKRCPPILKTATANTGKFRYRYAPLDEINSVILPVMGPLGLSVSYRIVQGVSEISAICVISHEMGHEEESGQVTMPITVYKDDDGKVVGANPAQCVGIAISYAKRYALLAKLGLSPEDDPDGEAANLQQPQRASDRPQAQPGSASAAPVSTKSEPAKDVPAMGRLRAVILDVKITPRQGKSDIAWVKFKGQKDDFSCWHTSKQANLVACKGREIECEYRDSKVGDRVLHNIEDFWIPNDAQNQSSLPLDSETQR